jgi:hypothetical protein
MFGMEKKSTKNTKGFVFELERELQSESIKRDLAKRIETRILKLKEILHSGSKKEEFEQLGVLLNGYHALAIVLGRVAQEKKQS